MEPVKRFCAHCGGELTAAGALYSALRLTFRPENAKFLTLESGEIMTKGLMCGECGVIEIVGDVNKLRRLTGLREPDAEPEP